MSSPRCTGQHPTNFQGFRIVDSVDVLCQLHCEITISHHHMGRAQTAFRESVSTPHQLPASCELSSLSALTRDVLLWLSWQLHAVEAYYVLISLSRLFYIDSRLDSVDTSEYFRDSGLKRPTPQLSHRQHHQASPLGCLSLRPGRNSMEVMDFV